MQHPILDSLAHGLSPTLVVLSNKVVKVIKEIQTSLPSIKDTIHNSKLSQQHLSPKYTTKDELIPFSQKS
jgi:hypothetical protein